LSKFYGRYLKDIGLFLGIKNKFKRVEEGTMYEIEEFYKEDGYELEDVLKTCIMNYYNKYLAQFNN